MGAKVCHRVSNDRTQERVMKFKKTLTAVGVAAIAGAGAMSVLPDAQAASAKSSQEIIQLAACNPCAAKKACGACNPCAAKKKRKSVALATPAPPRRPIDQRSNNSSSAFVVGREPRPAAGPRFTFWPRPPRLMRLRFLCRRLPSRIPREWPGCVRHSTAHRWLRPRAFRKT